MELGHFEKSFFKNERKKGSTGKNFGAISPTLINFLNGRFNPNMDTIRAFSFKIRPPLPLAPSPLAARLKYVVEPIYENASVL